MALETDLKINCPHCGEEFDNTRHGRMARANHIKMEHPDATSRAKAEAQAQEYLAGLPPVAQRFYEALERVIPRNPAKSCSLADTFARNTDTLGQNRHAFRSWITRHGLTQDQIAMVEEELFGVEGVTAGHPMGGSQVRAKWWAMCPSPAGATSPSSSSSLASRVPLLPSQGRCP